MDKTNSTTQPAREGSLDAPTRHPIPWQEESFYNEEELDKELRRVFDICHGCRRCFNLCDSFPKLFDAVDDSETGELDSVSSEQFKPIVDVCTLCDMCFLTKCPYVPPHEFNLDFPHLMLRYRAIEHKKGQTKLIAKELTKTDRNGKLGCSCSALANWASKTENSLSRGLLEKVTGVDKNAYLPPYAKKPLTKTKKQYPVNNTLPQRKAVVYATCFANYNSTRIGEAAMSVLARNGVEAELVYPECCGMPQLEHGDIKNVADRARRIAKVMEPYIDKGYTVISLTPSCSLMLKYEWPLINDDQLVKKLAESSMDISEYLVSLGKENNGLAPGLAPLGGNITIHIACHARALNIGQKGAELLRFLPDTGVEVIERCSGHGGSWGVMKDNFELAIKVGKPVARTAGKQSNDYVVSECPLAREHIVQGMERLESSLPENSFQHPIELIEYSYQLSQQANS